MRHQQVLRPGAVDGVAEAPAAERPATLGVRRVQAIEALAARRDRSDDHPLADRELILEPRTERVDHAHRFVSGDEARANRILALYDVNIGAADGGRSDAEHRFTRTGIGLRHFLDSQVSDTAENYRFHRIHDVLLRCQTVSMTSS